jgi:DNA-binding transcriptional regulator YiaG
MMPNMKLQTYLHKKKLTHEQFANMAGVSGQSVRNWISGIKKPTRHLQKIVEITGGKVTANDFF